MKALMADDLSAEALFPSLCSILWDKVGGSLHDQTDSFSQDFNPTRISPEKRWNKGKSKCGRASVVVEGNMANAEKSKTEFLQSPQNPNLFELISPPACPAFVYVMTHT